jgi:exonuclease 3'-5' domain-containing protein 1
MLIPARVSARASSSASARGRASSVAVAVASRSRAALSLARPPARVLALARARGVARMGNKPRLVCAKCASTFKRQTAQSTRFCKPCRAAASAKGETLDDDDDAYGGVVLGFKRANGDDSSGLERGALEGGGKRAEAGGSGGAAKKKKKRRKKPAAPTNAKSDPMCLEIVNTLDQRCEIIDATNYEIKMPACVETIKASSVVAVDCEGVRMSRTGPVTVVQCATRDAIYLIDVQSLGGRAFGDRNAGGLRDVLESSEAPMKLMFDCRMDSDALFHQFDVRLENVMDVQVLDVAARRALGKMIDRVAGIVKCAGTHLTSAETAVADDLKVRVKKLYAVEESTLWADRPLTDDVRRYAALDVYLLLKLHEKIMFDLREDKDDWVARTLKESSRRVLAFRELDVAVEQGVFTEASTIAPTF